MKENSVYTFWKEQVKKYGYDLKSVNFDLLEEELEIFHLEKLINNGEVVCDLGCGNGRTIIELSQKKQNSIFYGFDFVEEMIEVANEQKEKLDIKNIHFYVMDGCSATIKSKFPSKFDKVLTKRLLINLKGKLKLEAIDNVYNILKDKGTYIMIECFIEPLRKINLVRKALGLNEIKVRSFNEYLTYDFLKELEPMFKLNKQIELESLYYFISRIFNAYLSEGEPDYLAEINKLAVKLTKMGVSFVEDYGPEKIYLFKKQS